MNGDAAPAGGTEYRLERSLPQHRPVKQAVDPGRYRLWRHRQPPLEGRMPSERRRESHERPHHVAVARICVETRNRRAADQASHAVRRYEELLEPQPVTQTGEVEGQRSRRSSARAGERPNAATTSPCDSPALHALLPWLAPLPAIPGVRSAAAQ